ncbi:MAG: acyl carrier protein, partial [Lysobacterales bacterium CG_4_9_14_3_um_filter_62_6]
PELDLDTDFVSGLGLESIQVMEFVMTVEERFDIAIDLDTLSTVKSIRDLGAVVAKAKAVTP